MQNECNCDPLGFGGHDESCPRAGKSESIPTRPTPKPVAWIYERTFGVGKVAMPVWEPVVSLHEPVDDRALVQIRNVRPLYEACPTPEPLAGWVAEYIRRRPMKDELKGHIQWINEQAESIMATSAGAANTDGYPSGALQQINSMASDIGVNARMMLDRPTPQPDVDGLTVAISHQREAMAQAAQKPAPDVTDALRELWLWCRNWDCEFMDDDEFPECRKRIEAALAAQDGSA